MELHFTLLESWRRLHKFSRGYSYRIDQQENSPQRRVPRQARDVVRPVEPRRARSKEFWIKKYSELCELCGREKKSPFRKNERCKYLISLRQNFQF